MSEVGQKALDYARMISSNVDWDAEHPVLQYQGWTVYTTEKIDFRIVVTLAERHSIVMGIQTWAVYSSAGFEACIDLVRRSSETQYHEPLSVEIIPWGDVNLQGGMRRLGWAERDPLTQLVDDANRLLRIVGNDDAAPASWWKERATEYARIKEMRDSYAQNLSRLDSLLQLAEDKIADVA